MSTQGDVHPLGQHILALVQRVVEDGEAQVAHAQFVGVGKGQGHAAARALPVLDDAIPFAAGVARWLAHFEQHAVKHVGDGSGVQCMGIT